MATITVTTLADENDGVITSIVDLNTIPGGTGISLREAILAANNTPGADTITFNAGLSGGLIQLGSTLSVTEALTINGDIDGNHTADITITGDVLGDDAHVGASNITDIAATTAAAHLGDNVQLFNANATMTLNGLALTGGHAASTGGAVFSNDVLTVTDTTIAGNMADLSGGGAYATYIVGSNSTFSGNTAEYGGGAYAYALTATNSTFSGNTAANTGGGASGYLVDVTNSTFSGNSAPNAGGVNAYGLTVANSILLGNTGPEYQTTSLSTNGLNIIGVGSDTDGSDGVINAVSVGAVFASIDATTGGGLLADNGGPVKTIALKVDVSNPAIDAGLDSSAPVSDATGTMRTNMLGVANNGANISDLGAAEAIPEGSSLVVTTLSDVVNAYDNVTSLREAITYANVHAGADTITFNAGLSGGLIQLGSTLSVTEALTINGDIDGNHTADITITGDVNADDAHVGTSNITDIAATETAGHLGDNVQILHASSDLTLQGLVLTGGNAGPDAGGAVECDGAAVLLALTLTDTTISGNSAYVGGGVRVLGDLTATNSTFSGNIASLYGGGAHAYGTITAANTTFADNSVSGDGGGAYSVTFVATNSTFSGNSAASGRGGGARGHDMILTNSTFSGNSAATDGGGAYSLGDLTATNSTFSGNTASNSGGGAYSGISLTATNSILLGNTATTGSDYSTSSFTANGLNIIGVGSDTDGSDHVINAASVDAVFASVSGGAGVLANNGGLVQTIALKADTSNPAIDAANTSAPATDAAGHARVDQFSITNINGSAADLGAAEASEVPSLVVTTLSDVVADDGVTSLREAIALANANAGADTITFGASLAGGTITLALGELTISSDITIDGDAVGDDNAADITISGNNASRVFNVTSGTSTLDALSITGGRAEGGAGANDPFNVNGGKGGDGQGGAIFNSATLTIANSSLTGNSAVGGAGADSGTNGGSGGNGNGGAVYNSGTLTIASSTVGNNTATGGSAGGAGTNGGSGGDAGGAIYNTGDLTVTGSTFSGNTSTGGAGGSGGTNGGMGGDSIAVVQNAGDLTVTGSTFSSNTGTGGAGGSGGTNGGMGGGSIAVIHNSGQLTIAGSTFSTNASTGGGGAGGGINGGMGGDGGAAVYNGADASIINSTIAENTAVAGAGGGGGINSGMNGTAAGAVTNGSTTTFDFMHPMPVTTPGNLTILNSTIAGNGIGLSNEGYYDSMMGPMSGMLYGTFNLTNSIVLGNGTETSGPVTATGLNIVGTGSDTDATDHIIQAASSAAVFETGDLADNGGPVQTIALNPWLFNPAVDAADNTAPATDATGAARIDFSQFENPMTGSGADLGAVEMTDSNNALNATSAGNTAAIEQVAVAVDSAFTLAGPSGATLFALKVEIIDGFSPGQDVLSFANNGTTMGNITGSYNSGTGVLTLLSAGGTATFAEFQAAVRSVTYTNTSDNPDTTDRGATIVLYEATATKAAGFKTITVAAVNDAAALTGDLAATMNEGGTYVITSADLGFTDPDDTAAGVTFTASSLTNGTVLVNGSAANTFTGTQLAAGQVAFRHNGSETTAASFRVSVEDGNEDASTPTASTFNFTINPANDAAVLTGDLSATVAEGGTYRITAADLGFTDPDDTAAGVTFTASSLSNGTVVVNGSAANTFTGTQLAAGQVSFRHNGSETTAASFRVSVEDGNEDASTPVASTFNFTVNPVNDAVVLTGDLSATVAEGGTYRITAADLGFTDPDDTAAGVRFTASSLTNGTVLVNGSAASTFTGTQLAAGQVSFRHNGSETTAASFRVSAEDGNEDGSTPVASTFHFNVTPVNDAATAVVLSNVHSPIAENASTAARIKFADIAVTDMDGGHNVLSLAGADAGLFQITGNALYLKAGAALDFETNPVLNVTVNVNDAAVGGAVDASASLAIAVLNVAEGIMGTRGDDRMGGTSRADNIFGLAGNDTLTGGDGNDTITGGAGRDYLQGGDGDDVFVFASTQDSRPGLAADVITDFTRGDDRIDVSGIDAKIGLDDDQAFTFLGNASLPGTAGSLTYEIFNSAGTVNDKTVVYGDVNGDGRADFQIEMIGLKALTASDFIL